MVLISCFIPVVMLKQSIPKEHVEEFMIVKKPDKVTLKVGSKTWDVAVAYGKN